MLIFCNTTLWRELDDKHGIASALYFLANRVYLKGEYTRARALCEESLMLNRALGNTRRITYALCSLAQILLMTQGDQARVHELLEESLALAREMGDWRNMSRCFALLGEASLQQGDTTTARSFAEQCLELSQKIGDQQWIADALCLLGKVNFVQGNYTTARALYEQDLAIAKEGSYKPEHRLLPSA